MGRLYLAQLSGWIYCFQSCHSHLVNIDQIICLIYDFNTTNIYCNKNHVNKHWVMFTSEAGVLLLTCVLCCRFLFTNLCYFASVHCGGEDSEEIVFNRSQVLVILYSLFTSLMLSILFALFSCGSSPWLGAWAFCLAHSGFDAQ